MSGVDYASRVTGYARYALVGVALVAAVTSASIAARHTDPPATYAAESPLMYIADVGAGTVALAAGAIAFWARPRRAIGAVTAAMGLTWFAADVVGWEDGPAVVRSMGMVVAPFAVPLVAHLAVSYPSGRVSRHDARWFVGLSYGIAAVASVGRALFRDPFLDQHCWSNCTDNVFLLEADRHLTRWFNGFGLWVAIAVSVVTALVGPWRLVSATSVAQRATWFVLAPAAVVAVAFGVSAAVLLVDPTESPAEPKFAALFVIRAALVAALGGGVIWGAVRGRRMGRAVAQLADALGAAPTPGSLRETLAASLADDRLEVAYWLPDSARYVDAEGRTVEPRAGRGQATTTIVRGGQPLAVVVHDQAAAAGHDLEREIGATARLAVDNERLRAAVLAQLADLRASRARIVSTADSARQRLERNLHDGAQQRLLAVLYELRLASAAAANDGDISLVERLATASREANEAISELRDLAHGIYPAILAQAGLGPALRTLRDRASIPVEIAIATESRYPVDGEAAAYLVVAETIADAAGNGATHADVGVEERSGAVVVTVRHDGAMISTDVVLLLADRIGALGGRVDVDGTIVRVEIPCAS